MILTRILTCTALALTLAACGRVTVQAECGSVQNPADHRVVGGRAKQHSGQEAFWRESRRVTAVFRRLRQLFKGLRRGGTTTGGNGADLASDAPVAQPQLGPPGDDRLH